MLLDFNDMKEITAPGMNAIPVYYTHLNSRAFLQDLPIWR